MMEAGTSHSMIKTIAELIVRGPSGRITPLSLFDGDLINRLFARIGLGPRRPVHLLGRALVLIFLTWVPTAILAIAGHLYGATVDASNFFADFAAYAQFLVSLPLFVVAESIVGRATTEAGVEFACSGVLRPRGLARLELLHQQIGRWRKAWGPDLACLILGYALSFAVIMTEFTAHGTAATWHTRGEPGHWRLTGAGMWEFGVALPLLNFWWLRQIYKVLLWCYYLRGVSRLRLDLVATHPDRTGGIGFVSHVQGHFAWVIFAWGISNVAATVGYKIVVEQVDFWVPPVWGPVLGFVVIAPALFTVPLFMFTRRLAITKRLALRRYRQLVMEHARLVESKVLPQPAGKQETLPAAVDVAVMGQVAQLFERAENMRVVPFDFRSMTQLVSSSLGSVVSILPILHIEGPANRILEALVKILEHFPSGH